jgi:hypothetical protein
MPGVIPQEYAGSGASEHFVIWPICALENFGTDTRAATFKKTRRAPRLDWRGTEAVHSGGAERGSNQREAWHLQLPDALQFHR